MCFFVTKRYAIIEQKRNLSYRFHERNTIISVDPLNADFSSGSKILNFTKQIIAAFSTHECASLEQYAINFDNNNPSSTNGCCCFSLLRA